GIDAAVITPICPHSLTMRPIVTSKDADIRFKMISDGFLSLDGMFCENLESGSEVCVSACDERARFIRLSDKNLFTLIKNKLS
ncbi:MAG: NAD(+)/NADH kinase, partial [Clostridia bacterium]|nr:NAD(+)/NADH kinase [Clostridia bacterium]